ncbi:MAG: alpha/beta fold hydrolase, partial [Myxococcota bacterium]
MPEDRAQPDGRKISLRIAVVPSIKRQSEPDPLFLLVGGPGQAATEAGASIAALLSDVRSRRDIVLVDQRGTGGSNPLECSDKDEASDELRMPSLLPTGEFESCVEELEADPRHYTTPEATKDLDQVRQALGYEQINIWG